MGEIDIYWVVNRCAGRYSPVVHAAISSAQSRWNRRWERRNVCKLSECCVVFGLRVVLELWDGWMDHGTGTGTYGSLIPVVVHLFLSLLISLANLLPGTYTMIEPGCEEVNQGSDARRSMSICSSRERILSPGRQKCSSCQSHGHKYGPSSNASSEPVSNG